MGGTLSLLNLLQNWLCLLLLQVGPKFGPVKLNDDGSLNYESVVANYDVAMDWLSGLYGGWVGRV